MIPQQFDSQVRAIEPVGAYFRLSLAAPHEVTQAVTPGHFVAVAVGGVGGGMLLRRAFSIHNVTAASLDVVFARQGQGTTWLAGVRPGDVLDVVAPLGTPFLLPEQPMGAVLVAGGYGAAPMAMLARALRERGCAVTAILGAASHDRLFGVEDLRRDARSVEVTTDDGSAGSRGRVTDVLPQAMREVSAQVVYACGPMPMLQAVASVAADHGARSQCAVEESMACGIGVCMTCVLPVIGDDGVTRMVRSCVEGPVFPGDRVRWSQVHTVPVDTWGAGGGH